MGFYLPLSLSLSSPLSFPFLANTLVSFAALCFAIKMIFVSFIWLFLDLCSDHLLQTLHTAICSKATQMGGGKTGQGRGLNLWFAFCII